MASHTQGGQSYKEAGPSDKEPHRKPLKDQKSEFSTVRDSPPKTASITSSRKTGLIVLMLPSPAFSTPMSKLAQVGHGGHHTEWSCLSGHRF